MGLINVPKRPLLWKPPYAELDSEDPLAQGLIGLLLMNEGAGKKVFDLSGNGYDGINTNVVWSSGPNGPVLNYVETSNPYTLINEISAFGFTTEDFTVVTSYYSADWRPPNRIAFESS